VEALACLSAYRQVGRQAGDMGLREIVLRRALSVVLPEQRAERPCPE